MVFVCLAVWLAGCHFPAQRLLALPHIEHHSQRNEKRGKRAITTTTPQWTKRERTRRASYEKQQQPHIEHHCRCSRRRAVKAKVT